MPRGGRRPGAGAPKGNLNALKTGRYSPIIRGYALALWEIPFARFLITEIARASLRNARRRRRTIPPYLRRFWLGHHLVTKQSNKTPSPNSKTPKTPKNNQTRLS